MAAEMSDAKLDLILAKLSSLQADVRAIRCDVQAIRGSLASPETRVERVQPKQYDNLEAVRAQHRDLLSVYGQIREDSARFERRIDGNLSQVNQSIVALNESIDRQDFRSEELDRRITRLEEQRRQPRSHDSPQ